MKNTEGTESAEKVIRAPSARIPIFFVPSVPTVFHLFFLAVSPPPCHCLY